MSSYRSKLGQLVPPTITPSAKHQGVRQDVLHHIDVGRLVPSAENPRSTYPEEQIRQLADSLLELGQQEPITVYWSTVEQAYVILSGHCRYFAAKLAGLSSLMAVVVTEDIDAMRLLAKRMAENTARNDLHPLDAAKAIRQMMDGLKVTQQQVAKMLGRSQAWVSSQLALLTLPEDQRARLSKGAMPMQQARAAVVKRARRRRGPKQVKLQLGGLSAVITFKRVQDECTATEALERLRAVAQQLDDQQARDAA
jgi:ParB family chromosome partitioning protein